MVTLRHEPVPVPSAPPPRPGPWWWAGAVVAAAGSLALAVVPLAPSAWSLVGQGAQLVAVVVAVVAVVRMRGPARPVWALLVAWAALTWVGDDVFAYLDDVLGQQPFPGPADVAYAASYVAALGGLGLLARRRHRGRPDALAGVVVIVLASVAFMLTFVVAPMVTGSQTSTLGTVVAVMYPLLDIALLAVLARLMAETRWWTLPLALLTASFVVLLVADVAYDLAVLNGSGDALPAWLDALYLLPVFGLALSVTAPGADRIADEVESLERPTAVRFLLLTAAALAVPALTLGSALAEGHALIALLAGLTLAITALVLWQVRELLRAVAATEEEYRLLAENASDVVYRTDVDGVLLWLSPSVRDLLGFEADALVGLPASAMLHPDDVAVREAVVAQHSTDPLAYEARFRTADGGYRWISATGRWVVDAAGRPVARIGSLRDIEAEVHARAALERSERQFRLAMQSAPGGMAVVGLDRRFLSVNPALCRMLGHDAAWFASRSITDVIDADDDALDRSMRAAVLEGRLDSVTVDKRLHTADGRVLLVEHSLGVLRDVDGAPLSFVSQFVDVTDARQARESLRFMATHDPLTRLSNRHELMAALDRHLERTPRTGTQLGLVFLDLDSFKAVNDTYGHAAGDAVIIAVARRLRGLVREHDVVARIGGDEFVMLLPGLHSVDDAVRIAGMVHEALAEPATVADDGTELRVGVSIGIAMAGPGDDGDHLLVHADLAMYRAKASGLGTAVYDPDVDRPARRA